jgi:hypothetical protein
VPRDPLYAAALVQPGTGPGGHRKEDLCPELAVPVPHEAAVPHAKAAMEGPPRDSASSIGVPTLFMHGAADGLVGACVPAVVWAPCCFSLHHKSLPPPHALALTPQVAPCSACHVAAPPQVALDRVEALMACVERGKLHTYIHSGAHLVPTCSGACKQALTSFLDGPAAAAAMAAAAAAAGTGADGEEARAEEGGERVVVLAAAGG